MNVYYFLNACYLIDVCYSYHISVVVWCAVVGVNDTWGMSLSRGGGVGYDQLPEEWQAYVTTSILP